MIQRRFEWVRGVNMEFGGIERGLDGFRGVPRELEGFRVIRMGLEGLRRV